LASDWDRYEAAEDDEDDEEVARLSKLEFLKRGCEALSNMGEFDIYMQGYRERWPAVEGWQHTCKKYGNAKSEGSYASFFKTKIFPLKLKKCRLVHKDAILTIGNRLNLKAPVCSGITWEDLDPVLDLVMNRIDASATLKDAATYKLVVQIAEMVRNIITGEPPEEVDPDDLDLDDDDDLLASESEEDPSSKAGSSDPGSSASAARQNNNGDGDHGPGAPEEDYWESDRIKEIDDMIVTAMSPVDLGLPLLDSWTLQTPEQLAKSKKQKQLREKLGAVINCDDFFNTRENGCTLTVCSKDKPANARSLRLKDGQQVLLEFDEGSKFYPFDGKAASVLKASCASNEAEALQGELDKLQKSAREEVAAMRHAHKKQCQLQDKKAMESAKVDKHFGGDKDEEVLAALKKKLELDKKLEADIKDKQREYKEKAKDLQERISTAKSAAYCQVRVTQFGRNLTIPVECAQLDASHYLRVDSTEVDVESRVLGAKSHIVPIQLPCVWTAVQGDPTTFKMPLIRCDFKTTSPDEFILKPRTADFGTWKLQYKVPVEVVKEQPDATTDDREAVPAPEVDERLLSLFDDDTGEGPSAHAKAAKGPATSAKPTSTSTSTSADGDGLSPAAADSTSSSSSSSSSRAKNADKASAKPTAAANEKKLSAKEKREQTLQKCKDGLKKPNKSNKRQAPAAASQAAPATEDLLDPVTGLPVDESTSMDVGDELGDFLTGDLPDGAEERAEEMACDTIFALEEDDVEEKPKAKRQRKTQNAAKKK